MDKEDIEKKIDGLITALGATGEFLGTLRESLIAAGFTRSEAVYMCSNTLVGIIRNREGDSND